MWQNCHFFFSDARPDQQKSVFVFVVHKYQRSIFCDVFSSICGVNVAIVLSEQSSPTSCAKFRGVVPGGAGGVPWHPQILADKLTLSQPGGFGRLCPPNNAGTPGFSDLPTAVKFCVNDG